MQGDYLSKTGANRPIAIEPARESDKPRLSELYLELVRYHYERDNRYADAATAREELDSILAWIGHPRAAVLVARDGRDIVGFVMGWLQKPHLAVAQVRTGRLDMLAVTEAYRRRGIGQQLTDTLLDWFRQQGAERVFVSSAARNPASDAFWRKLGFEDFAVTRSKDLGPGIRD